MAPARTEKEKTAARQANYASTEEIQAKQQAAEESVQRAAAVRAARMPATRAMSAVDRAKIMTGTPGEGAVEGMKRAIQAHSPAVDKALSMLAALDTMLVKCQAIGIDCADLTGMASQMRRSLEAIRKEFM